MALSDTSCAISSGPRSRILSHEFGSSDVELYHSSGSSFHSVQIHHPIGSPSDSSAALRVVYTSTIMFESVECDRHRGGD